MYFEDFVIGKQTLTLEKRITVTNLDAFLDISGLRLPMFLSDEGAQRIGHEKRLVPGPMILSIAMGLAKETGLFDHVVAVVEFDELRFSKALHPEQSIKAEITVTHTKPTQNPERGLVTLAYKVINENHEVVLSAKAKYLMQTRHQG
jgi:itaconyl-CoA hydratase